MAAFFIYFLCNLLPCCELMMHCNTFLIIFIFIQRKHHYREAGNQYEHLGIDDEIYQD